MARVGELFRGRRRHVVIASGLAATAVVLGIAFWGRVATDDGSTPLPPVDRTTPTSPTQPDSSGPALTLTADEVVDDPSSFISSLAVSPTDPDVAAAVWWHCATKDCNHGLQAALAVTTDNWRTRSTRLIGSSTKPARTHLVVNALSDGRFIVHREATYGRTPLDLELVDPDLGLAQVVERAVGGNGLSPSEAMPATIFGGADAWAIDPARLTFRDLGAGRAWTSAALMPNGIIVASTSENRVGYSADSGESWRFVPDDAASRVDGRSAVGSAAPGTIAVLEGNDGCEGGCPDALDLSRDSGASWSTVDLGGYVGHLAAITSKGTFLYVATRTLGRPAELLRSTADDLGDLHAVLGGADSAQISRLSLSEANGMETITACGDEGRCVRSVDDGRAWTSFAMR